MTQLEEIARRAVTLEESGDGWGAHAAWKEYELVEDAQRDPSELLEETIRHSQQVLRFASSTGAT
jgi:hypothetical protein